MNIIEVKNLSKNFGNFKAVKKIGFSVEKGEVFGFLGLTVRVKPQPSTCLLD